jgi:hypothetical protein
MPLYFGSSNSVFRLLAVATPARTAALHPMLRDILAWVLKAHPLTATASPFAVTTMTV